jgi:hypothetical protein
VSNHSVIVSWRLSEEVQAFVDHDGHALRSMNAEQIEGDAADGTLRDGVHGGARGREAREFSAPFFFFFSARCERTGNEKWRVIDMSDYVLP